MRALALVGLVAFLACCETADAGIAVYQPKMGGSPLTERIAIFDSSVNEDDAIPRQKAAVPSLRMFRQSGDRVIGQRTNCCFGGLGQIILGKCGPGLIWTPCERRPNNYIVGWGLASVFNFDGDVVGRLSQFGPRTPDVNYVDVSAQLGARSLVTLPKSQVGIKDGGQEAKNAHEAGVKLLLRSFRDAPLLAQIGILAILGALAYGPIIFGLDRMVVVKRKGDALAYASICFGLTLGAMLFGLIVVY